MTLYKADIVLLYLHVFVGIKHSDFHPGRPFFKWLKVTNEYYDGILTNSMT